MPTSELPNREMDFLSHFEELRMRLLWSLLAVVAAMAAGWFLFTPAFTLICAPILQGIRAQGGTVMTVGLTEALFTKLKLAGAMGLILASPFILWQLWAFIRPGLTAREQRVAAPIAPAICCLFLMGAGLAYLMMPKIVGFFLYYVKDYNIAGGDKVTPNLMLQDAINFPLKVMFAFGLGFQLPIVLIALVALRVMSPATLLRQWRMATFIIGVIAAVLTPTSDPFNWALMMVPLCILYFGTVLIAYRVVRPAPETEEVEDA